MHILGVGTADPPARFTKAECLAAFEQSSWFSRLDARTHAGGRDVLQALERQLELRPDLHVPDDPVLPTNRFFACKGAQGIFSHSLSAGRKGADR